MKTLDRRLVEGHEHHDDVLGEAIRRSAFAHDLSDAADQRICAVDSGPETMKDRLQSVESRIQIRVKEQQ